MQALPTNKLPRLQTRIAISVSSLMLALAMTFAAVMANSAREQVLAQSQANLDALSVQMARELSVGMDRFLQAVVTQTYREVFRDPNATPAAMRHSLNEFKAANPEFAYVSVVDVNSAKVVAASGGIFEGGSAAGRRTFEDGKTGPFLGDVHDAVRLAELLPRPVNGESLRFLDVAAPIRDSDGRVIRVLATHVGWEWTQQLAKDVFGPLRQARSIDSFLIDSQGKVVLSSAADIKVGTALGSALPADDEKVAKWKDGKSYLTVSQATLPHGGFRGFGWRVVTRQSLDAALGPSDHLRIAFFAGALAFAIIGSALAWLVTQRLVRPVRLLAESALASTSGEWAESASSAAPHDTAETAAVQHALSELARRADVHLTASTEQQRHFLALAESLPQVTFLTDAFGEFIYVNRDYLRVNSQGEHFKLSDLASKMHAEDQSGFDECWTDSRLAARCLKVRCRLALEGPLMRWHAVEALPVKARDGVAAKWIGTMLDVHETILHQEAAAQTLENERAARRAAEQLATMRDEFLAIVSHELRSPLSVIRGWSDILLRKSTEAAVVLRAADVIRVNARLQTNLINDLLDITAATAGKLALNREPLDLGALVGEVATAQRKAADQKGVTLRSFSGASPIPVDGDRRRLAQVLTQLIDNALKFTAAGGTVEVQAAQTAGHAVVSVSDTGVGIDSGFIPHVFERMRQADSFKTRKAGGLGLGLSIVQSLVELHGGTVSVHSDGQGRGAMFRVELPLTAVVPASDRAGIDSDEAEPVELTAVKVLLVDDERDARDVAQVALGSLGAHVRAASSAAEALSILENEEFDVLVSDIGMPDMDGLQLMRAIRSSAHASARALPAVALSAFALDGDRRAGLEAGFQEYVDKPIVLRRLSLAIGAVVAAARVRPVGPSL